LGTILRGVWGVAKHAPMIAEIIHKIFGKNRPRAMLRAEHDPRIPENASENADIEKNPGPATQVISRPLKNRAIVEMNEPAFVPTAIVPEKIYGVVSLLPEGMVPTA